MTARVSGCPLGWRTHVVAVVGALAMALAPAAALAGAAGADSSASQSTKRAPRAAVWHRDDLPRARPAGAPARIVSLAPVVTETLFAVGAGDRVVGVTRFCDRPAEAQKIAKVGGYVDISLERVLALKPDLVIAMPSLGQRDVLDRLRDKRVPVLVVFGDTLDEVHGLVRAVGAAVAEDRAASDVVARLGVAEARLAALGLKRERAAVIVGSDPIVVAGPGTFAADALVAAGLVPAMPDDAPMWPQWSPESLAASRVDVLVAAEGPAAAAKLRALVARALPPARRPRVVASTRAILMRPGPSLADDLDELARILAAR